MNLLGTQRKINQNLKKSKNKFNSLGTDGFPQTPQGASIGRERKKKN
jgi:hypothetical protein